MSDTNGPWHPPYGPPPHGQQPPPYGYGPPQPPYGQQPPPYGYGPPQPPYGQQPPAWGPPPWVPPGRLSSWWSRVGALLIDSLIAAALTIVPVIVGIVLVRSATEDRVRYDGLYQTHESVVTSPLLLGIGIFFLVGGWLLGVGFTIWNLGWRQGKGGQSFGKQVLRIRVVHKDTGAPLGGGTGLLRWLLYYVLSGACFLDLLWPLWDEKHQTWHDMIVSSVVIDA